MKAELTYFKGTGKFYAEGTVDVDGDLPLFEIWEAVARLDPSPGLSGKWTEGPILVNVPGHRHEHLHMIMPKIEATSDQHTPNPTEYGEPWIYKGRHDDYIEDRTGRIVVWGEGALDNDDERGRRICACVNACQGIPTEHLEGTHRENADYWGQVARDRDELRKKLDDLESSADVDELYELRRERDELLTTLTSAVEVLKNIENDDGYIPDTIWAMRNAAITAGKRRFGP